MVPTTAEVPLIPRKLIFSNPNRLDPRLSPDGQSLAWRALVDGVLNIWVAPSDAPQDARPISWRTGRPIVHHNWSADSRYVVFSQDETGDENYHLYAADSVTGEVRDLTPIPGVAARWLLRSPDLPGELLIRLNDRDARWHDVWRLDLESGERTLLYENNDQLGSIVCDWQGNLRFARRNNPDKGGDELLRFSRDTLEPWQFIPFDDTLTTWTIAFNRTGTHLMMLSSIGRDTSALLRVDAYTGEETVLGAHATADVTRCRLDGQTFEPTAFAANPGRLTWMVLDPGVGKTFDQIRAHAPNADFTINSASNDDSKWVAMTWSAEQPAVYHLIDRTSDTISELFDTRPELKPYCLSAMQTITVKSRDDLNLVSYLTLPPNVTGNRPAEPLPMVLEVHGGPWGRNIYGYHRAHQWYANRGYAALSVNYRASTGFGKAFVKAGDREHAGKMHDDLIDAVEWAVCEGIARRDKVAIVGWSYGGYAAFVGATFTPDVFCCAVPIVGISDLVTMLETIPPYWTPMREQLNRRYADVTKEDGRAYLRSRSPIHKVDNITKPMLIGHGANDVRCTIAQSDMIVSAMQDKGIPVTYVVFPDEGHGFVKSENNIAFHAIVEAFLARHLGGRAEPVGDDFKGSSHEVRAGQDILEDSADAWVDSSTQ